MGHDRRAEAARRFARAADEMEAAVRMLQEEGLPPEPAGTFLQSLSALTEAVHRLVPPGDRLQAEPADLAGPAPCHVAAQERAAQVRGGGGNGRP